MRSAAWLLVALSVVPAAAEAQQCLGQAPWSSIKLGGSLEIGDGYTEVIGAIGAGKTGGFFFGAGLGVGDDSQVLLAGGVGKELSSKAGGKASLCPVGNVLFGLEKDDYSFYTISGGLGVGYPLASSSENMGFILTGTGQLGINHFNVTGFGGDTDLIGIIDAGIGLIFNNRVSVVPQLRLYIGSETDVALLVKANVSVGKQ